MVDSSKIGPSSGDAVPKRENMKRIHDEHGLRDVPQIGVIRRWTVLLLSVEGTEIRDAKADPTDRITQSTPRYILMFMWFGATSNEANPFPFPRSHLPREVVTRTELRSVPDEPHEPQLVVLRQGSC